MRHLKAGKRLGVTTAHRKAMMRNLVTSLLEHGEIKTTITRAKEMRKYFDKMIGLGKRNDLHARRQALAFIKSKDVVHKLFEEYGPLYQDRNGGYTRIYRIGTRLGDNAQMALIQMVGLKEEEPVITADDADEAIEEVKSELQAEEVAEAEAEAGEVETEAVEADKAEVESEAVEAEEADSESSEEEATEEEPAAEDAPEEEKIEDKEEKSEE